jgi:hypothetical protein
MAKKYRVDLTNEEREELELLITKRSSKSIEVKRAYILLAADEAGDKRWRDEQIHKTCNAAARSVGRVRGRFVEDGFRIAVYGKTREVFKEKIFDGKAAAQSTALRCSQVPEGYERWPLKLPADEMAEPEYVEAVSCGSGRQILKKTKLNHGR